MNKRHVTETSKEKQMVRGGGFKIGAEIEKVRKIFFETMEERVRMEVKTWDPENEIVLATRMKNNDQLLTGLKLEKRGAAVCPVMYMDDFFEMFLDGEDLERLALCMAEALNRSMIEAPMMEIITDYNKLRPYLSMFMVEIDRNREWLKDKVYDTVDLFARVCYVNCEFLKEGGENEAAGVSSYMVAVTLDMLSGLKCVKEQVIQDSLINLDREAEEAVILPISVLLSEMSSDSGISRNEKGYSSDPLVVTSKARHHGAILITLPKIQQRVADILDSDYYVVPSSIHEVITVCDCFVQSEEELLEIVRSVNIQEVEPDEILADELYHYDREKGILTRVEIL